VTSVEEFTSSLKDYSYLYFGDIGRLLSNYFREVERDLETANIKMHTDVYFSLISSISIISLIIPITLGFLFFSGIWNALAFLPKNGLTITSVSFLIPFVVILIGVIFPKFISSSKMSGLSIEIPYASMYMSVMTSGGLSPFESFVRMRNLELLPNMREEVARIQTIVMSTGSDPVSAMELAAKAVDMKDYNELLLGYASSVRTGGDALSYLYNQTHNMFKKLATRVKSSGETMALLMEAYTIVGILGVLGIFLVFVVGMSLPTAGVSISPNQFFMFSFIVMPFISVIFIFAGDAAQFNYPKSNWTPYKVMAVSLLIALLIGSQTILPFFDEKFLVIPQLKSLIIWFCELFNFAEGTEASFGVGLTLILFAIPVFISDYLTAGRESSIQDGITNFLRDLVEIRKSGLSPEKSFEVLSYKDYKAFSKHLKDISTKINWGYPIKRIYAEFEAQVNNWIALINMYLLIDTIEVGGGTEGSMETLATFSETTRQLELEKRAILAPLVIVPYIGAALLTGTTVLFLSFFTNSNLGVSVASATLYRTLLTPLALHSFTLGLVTGKVTSGRVSAGFKHAIFLTLVAMGGVWAVANLNMGGGII
jgi:flagellar protein FlaJ